MEVFLLLEREDTRMEALNPHRPGAQHSFLSNVQSAFCSMLNFSHCSVLHRTYKFNDRLILAARHLA